MDIVTDLTVPEELLADAKVEADTLPKLEINKLDLQWLQVYPRTAGATTLNICIRCKEFMYN